jgi:hypothetical protein
MRYEAPEVVDLGSAEGMIFGGCGCACDNCSDNANQGCPGGEGPAPQMPT